MAVPGATSLRAEDRFLALAPIRKVDVEDPRVRWILRGEAAFLMTARCSRVLLTETYFQLVGGEGLVIWVATTLTSTAVRQ